MVNVYMTSSTIKSKKRVKKAKTDDEKKNIMSSPSKAFCSNCGSEIETNLPFATGVETYQCNKCGTYGTITRREKEPSLMQFGSGDSSIVATITLDLRNLLGLTLSNTHVRCRNCGNYVVSGHSHCPFCKQYID